MIELAITLTLICIIALLVGSHFTFLDRLMVKVELEQLYATCYLLQRRAMIFHKQEQLLFDTDRHIYHYGNREYQLPSAVRFGTAHGVKGPPSSPQHEIKIPVTFPQHTITFSPEGIIQSGALYLTDRSQQCTYAVSCAVGHVSYLRKYQYTQGWVLLGDAV